VYVCICHAVTDSEIQNAVSEGVSDLKSLGECCGAGTNCGRCREHAQEIIDATQAAGVSYAA
jgi:bacterioferritin-associated ferredoxin